jgi:methyltransferase (TIGR00027 family)
LSRTLIPPVYVKALPALLDNGTMLEGRPSLTAHRVALRRAAHQLLDQPPVFEDPVALAIVGSQSAAALRADPAGAERRPGAGYLRAFMAVRSRYAEDMLAGAVERGVRQYVVLGAGLDTFAYRNPHVGQGLRVFEVDHPATQAWKRERLQEAAIPIPEGLTFAPVDFETQTLPDGLRDAGLELDTTTFFSWLGVTPYLTREAVMATLGFVATLPAGSGIVFDYSVPRESMSWLQRAAFDRLAARVAAAGEPWQTFFEPAALQADLKQAGFSRLEDLGTAELNTRYFADRRDGLKLAGMGRLMHAGV